MALSECFDHRQSSAASHGVAAKSGAMIAGTKYLGGLTACQASANGYTIAQAFSRGHHIGQHVGMLIGKILSGAAVAGLDFIEHQQPLMLITKRSQTGQIIFVWYPHTALALNRFHQHGNNIGMLLGNGGNGWQIVKGYAHKTLYQRGKALLDFSVAGSAECSESTAMEAVIHYDNGRLVHAFIVTIFAG